MAEYNQTMGFQSILDVALGEYSSKGFRMEEFGGFSLMLYYYNVVVGVIRLGDSTVKIIHEACREHLESLSAR